MADTTISLIFKDKRAYYNFEESWYYNSEKLTVAIKVRDCEIVTEKGEENGYTSIDNR